MAQKLGAGWLNYHHLLYFWTVAREGSIAQASARLRLAPPTISAQIRSLEGALGEQLFERSGRRLVLTEAGRLVYEYADEIFALGQEMVGALHGRPAQAAPALVVGVSDGVPKLIARRLLQPALRLPDPARLVCREDHPERLLAELALHRLDLVLTDAPMGSQVKIRAFNHLLGECGAAVFAAPALAAGLREGFPGSLDGAPLLLTTEASALRRALEGWLAQEGLRPEVRGEFDDSALLKTFGQAGLGAFLAPAPIAAEICAQYRVEVVGALPAVRERFYAITTERRIRHPAVRAISQAARDDLFGGE